MKLGSQVILTYPMPMPIIVIQFGPSSENQMFFIGPGRSSPGLRLPIPGPLTSKRPTMPGGQHKKQATIGQS